MPKVQETTEKYVERYGKHMEPQQRDTFAAAVRQMIQHIRSLKAMRWALDGVRRGRHQIDMTFLTDDFELNIPMADDDESSSLSLEMIIQE